MVELNFSLRCSELFVTNTTIKLEAGVTTVGLVVARLIQLLILRMQ